MKQLSWCIILIIIVFLSCLTVSSVNAGMQVSAGLFHTIGLRANGTLVAAGDNTYGQCNVSTWTGVTQIATGAFHTVGLKVNGRVVATGRNNSWAMQCDNLERYRPGCRRRVLYNRAKKRRNGDCCGK